MIGETSNLGCVRAAVRGVPTILSFVGHRVDHHQRQKRWEKVILLAVAKKWNSSATVGAADDRDKRGLETFRSKAKLQTGEEGHLSL